MPTSFSSIGNFVRGCLGRNGRLLLQLSDRKLSQRKVSHSFFMTWENGHLSAPVRADWSAAAVVFADWPDAEFVAVGEGGQILKLRRDGSTDESTIFAGKVTARGPIRGAASIGDALYVVGAAHQAFKISTPLTVTDLSIPVSLTRAQPDSVGLEAIAAFGENEIYAAGWEGEIWLYEGGNWSRVGGPTSLILTAIVCAPDESVYVVGQRGSLLRGRRNQWTVIDTPAIRENLWSAAWFMDRLFTSSSQQLFGLGQGELRSIELPEQPETFFWLDANTDRMLSVGADDVQLLLTDRALRVV